MSAAGKAVGIDIGGTKMAVAAVDAAGKLVARTTLPTEAEQGFPRAVERLTAAIRDVLRTPCWAPADLAGIGIGCAGPVDPRRGLINNPYTLGGWDRCDIVTPLRERFGCPVWLENDADAAVLGECAFGAGGGVDPVVMLTFGTGVGGAAIVRGTIYRGVHGEHPEIGHLPVASDGPQCYCGIRGCLESLASGNAIGEVGQAAGLPDTPAVFLAAQGDDPHAREIVDRAVNAAATAVWTLCHTFLPQRIILGGGIMEDHFHLFAPTMRERLDNATQFTRNAVSIEPAKLGNDAGLIGAACLAFGAADRPTANSP
jgi:glucokinase